MSFWIDSAIDETQVFPDMSDSLSILFQYDKKRNNEAREIWALIMLYF